MGYLQEKRREAQTMLNTFNYELSNEIVNKKLEQQKLIAKLIENDKYYGVLDIEDFDIMVETSDYDYFTETETITQVPIRKVLSYDGEAYEKGFELCDKMSTEDLEYVDYMDGEVIEEDGFIHEMR